MSRYVDQYISIYNFCLQIKPIYQLLLGELTPLAVPNTRWNTISVDFVIELLELSEFDMVITVINSMSKRVYFILIYTTVTIESITKLFLYYV